MAGGALFGRALPPVRAITRGPKFHWFGYYDKRQFDPTSRFCLGMEVDFEHRSPRAEDVIRLGVIDTERGDAWREIGSTRAWNWQQGCMLQWVPGSRDEVIWNDRRDGQFVSVVHNVKSGKERMLPHPIYTLSSDGKWGLSTDFRRLNNTRPGYGYAGIPDPNVAQAAPKDAGIWKVDLRTGEQKLLFSVADALDVPQPKGDWSYSPWNESKHWFNHLLISPDNRRFIFLHRWRGPKEKQSFATLLPWWHAENTKQRHVWPGLNVVNILANKGPVRADELTAQIELTRAAARNGGAGHVLYSWKTLRNDDPNGAGALRSRLYGGPVVAPASPWLGDAVPASPAAEFSRRGGGTLHVKWEPDPAVRFVVVQLRGERGWFTHAIVGSEVGDCAIPNGATSVALTAISKTGIASKTVQATAQ